MVVGVWWGIYGRVEGVDVTAGDEHKRYSREGLCTQRHSGRRRRSCFVAKREVEETNLGCG